MRIMPATCTASTPPRDACTGGSRPPVMLSPRPVWPTAGSTSGPARQGCNVLTGKVRWDFRQADAVLGQPCVNDHAVFFGTRDGFCYRLDRRTGGRQWQTVIGSPVVARPVLADGWLYVVGGAGELLRLDAT